MIRSAIRTNGYCIGLDHPPARGQMSRPTIIWIPSFCERTDLSDRIGDLAADCDRWRPSRIIDGNSRRLQSRISNGCSLSEFRSRRTFRNHLNRFDFEPWGIAFRRSALKGLAQAVTYGSDDDWHRLPEQARHFFRKQHPAARQTTSPNANGESSTNSFSISSLPTTSACSLRLSRMQNSSLNTAAGALS